MNEKEIKQNHTYLITCDGYSDGDEFISSLSDEEWKEISYSRIDDITCCDGFPSIAVDNIYGKIKENNLCWQAEITRVVTPRTDEEVKSIQRWIDFSNVCVEEKKGGVKNE